MGRRDAVQVTLEVIARMRALEPRLQVTWEPGWETRGNGTSANYEGGIVHHTATPSSLARPFPTQNLLRVGRIDLSGPLCNEAGPACTVDAPRIHVMAAHPANHAGASGGRSMGPLPVTSLFNPRVRGLEIDYAGTVPMLAGQLYVAHLWARANADVVGGGDIQRIRAHFETSVTGKVDIGFAPGRSYDMAVFRRDAAAYIAGSQEEIDMSALFDTRHEGRNVFDWMVHLSALVAQVPANVWAMPVLREVDGKVVKVNALQELADAKSAALRLEGREVTDVDEQEIIAGLSASLTATVRGSASAMSIEDIRGLADELADELDRRERDSDPATGPVS